MNKTRMEPENDIIWESEEEVAAYEEVDENAMMDVAAFEEVCEGEEEQLQQTQATNTREHHKELRITRPAFIMCTHISIQTIFPIQKYNLQIYKIT